jgi:hypothetical protein
MSDFKKGDRVCYAAKFLNSIGEYSKEAADQVGVVAEIRDYDLKHPVLHVRWDGEDEDRSGLACNFIHADRKHLEPR